MKKLLFLLPAAALLLQACSNDFEVTAPWNEIPAVYAILSPKDTANYIRVEKAFLDPDSSALKIAQIADSLYFPENAIDVYLERSSTGQRFQLNRVDGNLEGHVRTGGIFASQPNWLYKTKQPLAEAETYKLVIIRADGKPDITAETTIPKEFTFSTPYKGQNNINFERDKSALVKWRSDVNGVYFTINFRIRYRENALDGLLLGRDTLYWTPVPNIRRTDKLNNNTYEGVAEISTQSFYSFLVEHIPAASDRVRHFDGIDITITGGGKEIERYLETAAANSGITGAEVIPTYTNLSEGYGIFTAKNYAILDKVLVKEETINSMNKQSPEKNLNFQ